MRIKELAIMKQHLNAAINEYDSIGIITHKTPDGDGLGASLAMQELLARRNKKADVVLEEPIPVVYDFLDGERRTVIFSENLRYDLLIILDCHEKERVGRCEPLVPFSQKVFALDHHIQGEMIPDSETYLDTNTVSVGAILFKMFEDELDALPPESAQYIARAIYTTILNDTDNFLNANVDAQSFAICSKLMKYNIQPGRITELFLLSKPANEMRFIGEVLSTIQTFDDDNILFIDSTYEMLRRNNLEQEVNNKLTRWVKGTKNVKVTVCFQEVNRNRYRLSLRSNYINVNKIATKYGGGGHKKASGCEIKGNLDTVKQTILEDIREQL
jgi:phosphoesterase RecJ-like protein